VLQLTWGIEYAVHGFGPLDNHWPYLLAVNRLSNGGAGVPYQASDVLDWHTVVGEQRDEAVPQLPGRPLLRREPGRLRDPSEAAPDVVRVELGADLRDEHETVALSPLRMPA
jgi:hypothetical protein